ncbi:MAG TPA: ATP-grasp domain-containing protein [Candidatus Limnocylindrales bacterium]|nr:ATP-grasp domain-containing protein [Candidatus Limnocylindrales bacterium]
MTRVLLLIPDRTYRTADFMAAAADLGVDVVVGSRDVSPLAATGDGRFVQVPLDDAAEAARVVGSFATELPLDAVVGVDDGSTLAAAASSAALGLPANSVNAVAASLDKAEARRRFAAAGLPTPFHRVWSAAADPEEVATTPGLPVVVKPVDLSGSRGVIRADTPDELAAAFARVSAIVSSPDVCPPGSEPQRIIVEEYIPGVEVAVEGLLRGGKLEVLAVFDKPDPLEGPFFEETIYVTPSRMSAADQTRVIATVARACAALGLTEGPVHGEVRLNGRGAWILEVAARSIGGLCARTLRFGAGLTLEELIIRHAAGLPLDDASLRREEVASGVMMLPIRAAGRLVEVPGQDEARAVPGIVGLTITIPRGRDLVPLPEGDRYLGFLFARADSPAAVEQALREATALLEVVVA